MKEKPNGLSMYTRSVGTFQDNLMGSQPRLLPQLQSPQNLFLCEESYELIRLDRSRRSKFSD